MPVTIYGDGSKYGDADAIYGRISADLLAAQDARVRETGLKVTVINSHLNAWELFAGERLGSFKPYNAGLGNADQSYYAYRGSSDACLLSNGHIVRIRNGTDTDMQFDRQIWVQEITNPLDPNQWVDGITPVWNVLYSGNHYACAIVADGTSYIVYSAKSDGFYRNNVKVYDISTDFPDEPGSAFAWTVQPVLDKKDALYLGVIHSDPVLEPTTGNPARDMQFYYVEDMSIPTTPLYDQTNFRWKRNSIEAAKLPDGRIGRVQSNTWYFDPRKANQGNTVLSMFCDSGASGNTPHEPYLIRGLGGGAEGNNFIVIVGMNLLSDGYYYVLSVEAHEDENYESVTNIGGQLSWQRSKDMVYWSEPMGAGFVAGKGTTLIESSGYVWLLDNGAVWRRPIAPTETDVSNYVPSLDFEIPRDNQPATGEALVANPGGVNEALHTLSDREIRIEIGLKTRTGSYEYREWNKWFLTQVDRVLDNPANRLHLTFGDLWARLDNPFRDTVNIVGQIAWRDWDVDKRNKSFNYYFLGDTQPVATKEANANQLTTSGTVLYTGWKGLNGFFEARFSGYANPSSARPRLIFRYRDVDNYMFLEINPGVDVRIWQRFNGANTSLGFHNISADTPGNPILGLRITWGIYEIFYQGVSIGTGQIEDPDLILPGYVGFMMSDNASFRISQFSLDEWEQSVITADLVKRVLAWGDFHDVKVSSGDGRQLAIIWGPQTDLPTPAAALAQALISEKLQIIWRDGFVEVGKFVDTAPARVIQDTIISSSQTDNAARRINFAAVDGNDDSWLQFDAADIQSRDREINAYFDLPELMDLASVKARAEEEIRLSSGGQSPQGVTPLYFDLWRTDCVTWIDQAGNSHLVRIEGFKVDIDQSQKPHQHQEFDNSILSTAGSIPAVDPPADSVDYVPVVDSTPAVDPPVAPPSPSPSPIPPPPAPTPLSAAGYGSLVNVDSKANLQNDNRDVIHRFKAGVTDTLKSIIWQQRGGSGGYSLGTGGTYAVSVHDDDGTGKPATAVLATQAYTPGNPGFPSGWTTYTKVTFASPSLLVKDRIYYIKFHNTHATPTGNFVSVNELFIFGASPLPSGFGRQPKFNDSDYAVLFGAPGSYVVQSRYTADMDLEYTGGHHDGLGYIGVLAQNGHAVDYGLVSGANWVRERFTVTGGTRNITQISVRMRRVSGSGAIKCRLETGGGTLIEEKSFPAASVAQSAAGNDDGGWVWITFSLSGSKALTNGSTFNVVLSTNSGTVYAIAYVRKGTSSSAPPTGFSSALYFADGVGQQSSNSGGSYSDFYAFDGDNPSTQMIMR